MALYEELCEINMIEPVRDRLARGELLLLPEGKLQVVTRGVWESPWYYTKQEQDRACVLWLGVYYNSYKIIPRGCRSCWKVILRIETLRDLFRIKELQEELGLPSKCGLEQRPFTGKLGAYGAYWYAPLTEGLKGGRELFTKVQAALDLRAGCKTFVPILVHGCSEFERAYGSSDGWEAIAQERDWNKREDLIDAVLKYEGDFRNKPEQTTLHRVDVMQRWIEWAYEHGDPTYRDFTNYEFVPKRLDYNGSSHVESDFILGPINTPGGWDARGSVIDS